MSLAIENHDIVLLFKSGTLLRELLLFDQVILKSNRLKEIEYLINAYGYEGTSRLLESGALKFHYHAQNIGEIKKLGSLTYDNYLPDNSYSFGLMTMADSNDFLSSGIRNVEQIKNLEPSQKTKLIDKILKCIENPVSNVGEEAIDQMSLDIMNNIAQTKIAVRKWLSFTYKIECNVSDFDLSFVKIGQHTFQDKTNIGSIFKLNKEDEHQVVGRGMLSVGSLNLCLSEMKHYNATGGFSHDDIPMYNSKLEFIMKHYNPDILEQNLLRVINVLDLPDFDNMNNSYEVDIEKLLKLRNSQECLSFRRWLSSINTINEKELTALTKNIRINIGNVLQSKKGKSSRFILSSGVGLLGPIGTVAGITLGAIDCFIISKLFPKNSIAGFLGHGYPSIFKKL